MTVCVRNRIMENGVDTYMTWLGKPVDFPRLHGESQETVFENESFDWAHLVTTKAQPLHLCYTGVDQATDRNRYHALSFNVIE